MAKKFEIVLDSAGIQQMLKSSEMQSVLQEHAKRIQGNCGAEYESSVSVGKKRAYGRVETATEHAFFSNMHNNTLLKGLK